MPVDVALTACAACFIAGMVLSAWRANDAVRARGEQLTDARQRCADLELEVERLDGACIELRAENSWLRGVSHSDPEAV